MNKSNNIVHHKHIINTNSLESIDDYLLITSNIFIFSHVIRHYSFFFINVLANSSKSLWKLITTYTQLFNRCFRTSLMFCQIFFKLSKILLISNAFVFIIIIINFVSHHRRISQTKRFSKINVIRANEQREKLIVHCDIERLFVLIHRFIWHLQLIVRHFRLCWKLIKVWIFTLSTNLSRLSSFFSQQHRHRSLWHLI